MLSKSGEDLTRYFPDIVGAALALKAKKFTMDGEIVVPVGGDFSFDDLLQRIHPAASRVRMLAAKTPALYLAFDLLKEGKKDVAAKPLSERRPLLEEFAESRLSGSALFRLSPASRAFKEGEGRQRRRHTEDKAVPKRGLRHRRLPIRREETGWPQGRRVRAIRSLRLRWSA